jgi:hypothetical protein
VRGVHGRAQGPHRAAVHAPVRVWAVCAAALGAGRVVPGVPRAPRREDGGIGGVAGSVDDVESKSIPGSELGHLSHRFSLSTTVEQSTAGQGGGGRAGADGAGDGITHAEGAERRTEAAEDASSAAEAAVPSSPCSSRTPVATSLLKSKVCDVRSPVPDCRVLLNSQPPRKLCTRTQHQWR